MSVGGVALEGALKKGEFFFLFSLAKMSMAKKHACFHRIKSTQARMPFYRRAPMQPNRRAPMQPNSLHAHGQAHTVCVRPTCTTLVDSDKYSCCKEHNSESTSSRGEGRE